jgi:hypothetical protein
VVDVDGQLFTVPFAKSATTGQQSPVRLTAISFFFSGLRYMQDNTRYAFLQMDDRALVYRGADQPDMSVINPESDVWQHVKVNRFSPGYRSFLTSRLTDSISLSIDQLANTIFCFEQRWSIDRGCWSKRTRTLQLVFRQMESLYRRAARAGLYCAGRPDMVPSCPYRCC